MKYKIRHLKLQIQKNLNLHYLLGQGFFIAKALAYCKKPNKYNGILRLTPDKIPSAKT